jgi:arginine/lysine/ornithine decarboxylase
MQEWMEKTCPRDGNTEEGGRHILQTRLEEYAAQGLYPFHMPGHKRRVEPAPGLPAAWDVTEVPGTDDLHDASGILQEAMSRTAQLWGADRTWYLVNGSTCGLLAGIRALAGRNSSVICARNCHKAVYHALELSGCHVHWIMPPVDPDWGICGSITAVQVADRIRRHPSVKAVILTSPTYEGVLSDIEGICRICHARNIPVLVDEAHGAHLLPMSREAGFPAGALACGADIVVQSPHKTLPSLTQTALLHLQGNLVDPALIEDELDIFETSSPSYPLMASLDGCTGILREEGRELFDKWAAGLGRFDARVRSLQKIRVLRRTLSAGGERGSSAIPEGFYDPGKILIDAGPVGMTGAQLALILRREWKMETEMSQGNLLLAMTSLCDEEDATDRLADALIGIEASAEDPVQGRTRESSDQDGSAASGITQDLSRLRPVTMCSLWEAYSQEAVRVPVCDAAGRISARCLYFYPPGIPFLAPGELITDDILRLLAQAGRSGGTDCRGIRDGMILCLRE